MANAEFKGDVVRIEKLTIAGGPAGAPTLVCSIQFTSQDGTVHAVAQHSFLLDPEVSTDGLVPAVAELMRVLTTRIEAVHFARPNDVENPIFQGIAEAVRAMPKAPDEPGTQG
jgi:hypothetical protein